MTMCRVLFVAFLLVSLAPAEGRAWQPWTTDFNVDFAFAEDVSPEDEWLIRESVRFAWDYVDRTLGVRIRERSTVEVGMEPNPPASAYAGNSTIIVSPHHQVWLDSSPLNRSKIMVHEYFHLVQADLMDQLFDPGPIWLLEGSAELIAFQAISSLGLVEFGAVRDRWITYGLNGALGSTPLEGMEPGAASPDILCCMYELIPLAVQELVAQRGEQAIVDFYRLVGLAGSWQDAFYRAFRQTPDEFYAAFAVSRQQLAPAGFDHSAIAYPSFVSGGAGDFTAETMPDSLALDEQVFMMGLTAPGAYCSLVVTGQQGNLLTSQDTYAGIDGKVFWFWTVPNSLTDNTVLAGFDCGVAPTTIEIDVG